MVVKYVELRKKELWDTGGMLEELKEEESRLAKMLTSKQLAVDVAQKKVGYLQSSLEDRRSMLSDVSKDIERNSTQLEREKEIERGLSSTIQLIEHRPHDLEDAGYSVEKMSSTLSDSNRVMDDLRSSLRMSRCHWKESVRREPHLHPFCLCAHLENSGNCLQCEEEFSAMWKRSHGLDTLPQRMDATSRDILPLRTPRGCKVFPGTSPAHVGSSGVATCSKQGSVFNSESKGTIEETPKRFTPCSSAQASGSQKNENHGDVAHFRRPDECPDKSDFHPRKLSMGGTTIDHVEEVQRLPTSPTWLSGGPSPEKETTPTNVEGEPLCAVTAPDILPPPSKGSEEETNDDSATNSMDAIVGEAKEGNDIHAITGKAFECEDKQAGSQVPIAQVSSEHGVSSSKGRESTGPVIVKAVSSHVQQQSLVHESSNRTTTEGSQKADSATTGSMHLRQNPKLSRKGALSKADVGDSPKPVRKTQRKVLLPNEDDLERSCDGPHATLKNARHGKRKGHPKGTHSAMKNMNNVSPVATMKAIGLFKVLRQRMSHHLY